MTGILAPGATLANPAPVQTGFASLPASLPASTHPVRAGGSAVPTQAWLAFCQRLPGECALDETEPTVITLDSETWAEIVAVNARVNRDILPVTDQDHWGELDRWDYPDDGMGDCEDIQLLKRRQLVESGLPRRALRMTVVIDEEGAGHAVMMVRTDRGDFILDNKRDAVLPWSQTGYTYVKREGAEGKAWVSLTDRAGPMLTANK
ncbi:transglutaminase-like cysteine peptidase [Microvirga sp. BT291]|nr:transglutaminase-like cysteine peptidase [Microvirga pudoricolor]MBM6595449.1 transglutaminase-like cysteine peptidase [Microvirga pudoricolor]